ncbi:MAG TPA: Nif3-like dinuclear metal center hexameric protein [Clostridia bacterium]
MAKLSEIIDFLNQIAPPEQKEDWDNIGFLTGQKDAKIYKCVLCLDVTSAVLDESIELGANLIVSHHPFIFKPINSITDQTLQGRKLLKAIKNDINVFSAHTNLDSSEQGINDYIARLLDLKDITRFGLKNCDWQGGRIGELKEPVKLIELAKKLKTLLNDDSVRIVGKKDGLVKKIALISGGAGKPEYLTAAVNAGADCYVSGDFSYHAALEAFERDFSFIICSHYCMERVILNRLRGLLAERFADVQFIISQKEQNPVEAI